MVSVRVSSLQMTAEREVGSGEQRHSHCTEG